MHKSLPDVVHVKSTSLDAAVSAVSNIDLLHEHGGHGTRPLISQLDSEDKASKGVHAISLSCQDPKDSLSKGILHGLSPIPKLAKLVPILEPTIQALKRIVKVGGKALACVLAVLVCILLLVVVDHKVSNSGASAQVLVIEDTAPPKNKFVRYFGGLAQSSNARHVSRHKVKYAPPGLGRPLEGRTDVEMVLVQPSESDLVDIFSDYRGDKFQFNKVVTKHSDPAVGYCLEYNLKSLYDNNMLLINSLNHNTGSEIGTSSAEAMSCLFKSPTEGMLVPGFVCTGDSRSILDMEMTRIVIKGVKRTYGNLHTLHRTFPLNNWFTGSRKRSRLKSRCTTSAMLLAPNCKCHPPNLDDHIKAHGKVYVAHYDPDNSTMVVSQAQRDTLDDTVMTFVRAKDPADIWKSSGNPGMVYCTSRFLRYQEESTDRCINNEGEFVGFVCPYTSDTANMKLLTKCESIVDDCNVRDPLTRRDKTCINLAVGKQPRLEDFKLNKDCGCLKY